MKKLGLKYNRTSGNIILKLVPVLKSLNGSMEYIMERGDKTLFRVENIAGTMYLRTRTGLKVGQTHKIWLRPKYKKQERRKTEKKETKGKSKKANKDAHVLGVREAMRFALHLQIEVV
jgi:hypothetical protein